MSALSSHGVFPLYPMIEYNLLSSNNLMYANGFIIKNQATATLRAVEKNESGPTNGEDDIEKRDDVNHQQG